ncbi:MAG: hypothetical protein AB7O84_08075 [Planctomycetota bacterium]
MVYAEGAAEASAGEGLPPSPGETLDELHRGAAHEFVHRLLVDRQPGLAAELEFLGPLRTQARVPRGSDLRHPKRLRQLLTWPDHRPHPDLIVVFVDEDGDAERRSDLTAIVLDAPHVPVLAIPVREFEAWLLADPDALRDQLGGAPVHIDNLERLDPGEAKELLQRRIAESPAVRTARDALGVRRALAAAASLDRLGRLDSFRRLRQDLGQAISRMDG